MRFKGLKSLISNLRLEFVFDLFATNTWMVLINNEFRIHTTNKTIFSSDALQVLIYFSLDLGCLSPLLRTTSLRSREIRNSNTCCFWYVRFIISPTYILIFVFALPSDSFSAIKTISFSLFTLVYGNNLIIATCVLWSYCFSVHILVILKIFTIFFHTRRKRISLWECISRKWNCLDRNV